MSGVAMIVAGVALATGAEVVAPSSAIDAPQRPKHATSQPRVRAVGRAVGRTAPTVPPPLDLSEPVIRKAIADSKDPLDDVVMPRGAAFGVGGAPQQAGLDQGFRRAEIPTCMTPAAYTFDPPQVGPIGLGGILALPLLVHAIVTGTCRH